MHPSDAFTAGKFKEYLKWLFVEGTVLFLPILLSMVLTDFQVKKALGIGIAIWLIFKAFNHFKILNGVKEKSNILKTLSQPGKEVKDLKQPGEQCQKDIQEPQPVDQRSKAVKASEQSNQCINNDFGSQNGIEQRSVDDQIHTEQSIQCLNERLKFLEASGQSSSLEAECPKQSIQYLNSEADCSEQPSQRLEQNVECSEEFSHSFNEEVRYPEQFSHGSGKAVELPQQSIQSLSKGYLEQTIKSLNQEIGYKKGSIQRLSQQIKYLEESIQKLSNEIGYQEQITQMLNKEAGYLEQSIQNLSQEMGYTELSNQSFCTEVEFLEPSSQDLNEEIGYPEPSSQYLSQEVEDSEQSSQDLCQLEYPEQSKQELSQKVAFLEDFSKGSNKQVGYYSEEPSQNLNREIKHSEQSNQEVGCPEDFSKGMSHEAIKDSETSQSLYHENESLKTIQSLNHEAEGSEFFDESLHLKLNPSELVQNVEFEGQEQSKRSFNEEVEVLALSNSRSDVTIQEILNLSLGREVGETEQSSNEQDTSDGGSEYWKRKVSLSSLIEFFETSRKKQRTEKKGITNVRSDTTECIKENNQGGIGLKPLLQVTESETSMFQPTKEGNWKAPDIDEEIEILPCRSDRKEATYEFSGIQGAGAVSRNFVFRFDAVKDDSSVQMCEQNSESSSTKEPCSTYASNESHVVINDSRSHLDERLDSLQRSLHSLAEENIELIERCSQDGYDDSLSLASSGVNNIDLRFIYSVE